jgi:hypothetical protein
MSEFGHLLNEAQALLLCMRADTAPAAEVRAEMIAILQAWRKGELLPMHKAPLLSQRIYGDLFSLSVQNNEKHR